MCARTPCQSKGIIMIYRKQMSLTHDQNRWPGRSQELKGKSVADSFLYIAQHWKGLLFNT